MRIFFFLFLFHCCCETHCEFVVSAMIFSAITEFSFGVKKIYLFSTLELQSQRKCHSSKWFAWWNAFCCCEWVVALKFWWEWNCFAHSFRYIWATTSNQIQMHKCREKSYHFTERAMAWAAKNKTLSRITFYV